MELSVLLIIVMASVGTARQRPSGGKSFEHPCICPAHCILHVSSTNDVIQVYKSTSEKDKLFCFSSQPIKWTLGWNSKPFPNMKGHLKLQRVSKPRNERFCLSLRIIQSSPTWDTSTLFAKCETNRTGNGSSRWYGSTRGKLFDPQDFKFNPKVTTDSKNSTEELYDEKESAADHTTVSTSVPTIVGAVGGAAAFVVLLLILFLFILLRKTKKQRHQIKITKEEIDEFMLGVAAEKANAKGINGLFVLPYDTKLEIPKSDVTFRSTVLGSGAFGQVVKGTYQGGPVAIKMLKNNASQNADYLKSLLGELKVMSYLGSHPNLVGLVGAITRDVKRGEVYLIFELCSNGNAQKFVKDNRDNFMDMLAGQSPSHRCYVGKSASKFPNATSQGFNLTTRDLVRWAYEVASGMDYVAAQNVYHGDLAARNILLTESLTAKVGDFGLSKQVDMERYNCYVQKKECPLPLKWMAIESLRDLMFSIQSDVWSFGVTTWELFTLGTTPYPGMDWNFESWKLLCEGNRLEKPKYASESIYDIMMSCWNEDPKASPTFSMLRDLLYTEHHKFLNIRSN